MSQFFKLNSASILAASGLVALLVLPGCGGGGGGSSNSGGGTPTAVDGTYTATVVPSTAVPSDGRAPTTNLVVTNGRGRSAFTFYLQPSVVAAVQAAVDKGLRDAGYPGDIPNNQVPTSINFNATGVADGSGKLVLTQTLTSRANVSLCGRATLTIDSTLVPNGTSASGQGTYSIDFADNLTVRVRGTNQTVGGTCDNLPLRAGTVAFTR